MAKYTIKDVIIDPEDPRLEGAIGKEVYFSETPSDVLKRANNDDSLFKSNLKDCVEGSGHPFITTGANWECIILKKEESKPFDNEKDFMFYHNCSDNKLCNSGCDSSVLYLNRHGIWLHDKLDDRFVMVTEFWDYGVVISSDTDTTTWQELAERYEFLDGSPCCMEVAV